MSNIDYIVAAIGFLSGSVIIYCHNTIKNHEKLKNKNKSNFFLAFWQFSNSIPATLDDSNFKESMERIYNLIRDSNIIEKKLFELKVIFLLEITGIIALFILIIINFFNILLSGNFFIIPIFIILFETILWIINLSIDQILNKMELKYE